MTMSYFPIFLALKDKNCLVVGAGGVGLRKIKALLSSSPRKIVVVDPHLKEDPLRKVLKSPVVELKKRAFKEEDLEGKFLVIASSNDEVLNKKISRLCEEKNILCNIVDRPELCNFIVPSVIKRGDISVAISTGGKSPAMASILKKKIQGSISEKDVRLTSLLGGLRPHILRLNKGSKYNRRLFYLIAWDKAISDAIEYNHKQKLINRLTEILPLNLHTIQEVVNAIW